MPQLVFLWIMVSSFHGILKNRVRTCGCFAKGKKGGVNIIFTPLVFFPFRHKLFRPSPLVVTPTFPLLPRSDQHL